MRKLIDEYPYNRSLQTHHNDLTVAEDYLSRFWETPALVLGSARAGYYLVLKFLGLKRSDHILIPDFMCQAILNITNTTCYPVKNSDNRTKAVLVFHQWGYPQDMDKVLSEAWSRNLIVIEDCAHALDSKYKGRLVGTFGEAAVFSLAKTLPTYLGGVLVSKNQGLLDFVKSERSKKNNFSNKVFNFLAGRVAKKSFERGKSRFWLDIIYLKSIHYPNIGRYLRFLPPSEAEFEAALRQRRENYQILKNSLKKELLISDWDASIDPNPFLVPVFLPEEKLARVRQRLLEKKFLVDVLHFDVNRNVFDPKHKKCLAVPCHQAIEQRKLEQMAQIINSA